MTQMGQGLQQFSTEAIPSKLHRVEQSRMNANLESHASSLHTAGAKLERQHDIALELAEARGQQMTQEASTKREPADRHL